MEKSRKKKKIVLILLLLAVIGLSIGFAAFSADLIISSSATVRAGDGTDTFKVVFSESQTELVGSKPIASNENTGAIVGEGATFSGNKLSGLSVEFTGKGQKATWTLYAYNNGMFDAYLNSVTLTNAQKKDADGGVIETYNLPIKGIALPGTRQDYVDTATADMKLTVQVGNSPAYASTTTNIDGHELEKEKGEKVVVTLEYPTDADIADGDFEVFIGDIEIGYGSVDTEN